MTATSEIKEHMEVLGSDGEHVGTVDHLQGETRIKLTKSDSADGHHHLIPADWVDHVDEHVHLNVSSMEAFDNWEEGEMELEDEGGSQMAASEADADEDQDGWVEERR